MSLPPYDTIYQEPLKERCARQLDVVQLDGADRGEFNAAIRRHAELVTENFLVFFDPVGDGAEDDGSQPPDGDGDDGGKDEEVDISEDLPEEGEEGWECSECGVTKGYQAFSQIMLRPGRSDRRCERCIDAEETQFRQKEEVLEAEDRPGDGEKGWDCSGCGVAKGAHAFSNRQLKMQRRHRRCRRCVIAEEVQLRQNRPAPMRVFSIGPEGQTRCLPPPDREVLWVRFVGYALGSPRTGLALHVAYGTVEDIVTADPQALRFSQPRRPMEIQPGDRIDYEMFEEGDSADENIGRFRAVNILSGDIARWRRFEFSVQCGEEADPYEVPDSVSRKQEMELELNLRVDFASGMVKSARFR
jgi:hypothetical protein